MNSLIREGTFQDIDVELTKILQSMAKTGSFRNEVLNAGLITTPLGSMITVADEQCLCLLEFFDDQKSKFNLAKLSKIYDSSINISDSLPISSIRKELEDYFVGALRIFRTPVRLSGSDFQKCAWAELNNIPYGETRSYVQQASAIGRESAFRAVANANGANMFAILIPCHRVIRKNGELGGYSSGIDRKIWLQNHERKFLGHFLS